jgi:hypothetical protein
MLTYISRTIVLNALNPSSMFTSEISVTLFVIISLLVYLDDNNAEETRSKLTLVEDKMITTYEGREISIHHWREMKRMSHCDKPLTNHQPHQRRRHRYLQQHLPTNII